MDFAKGAMFGIMAGAVIGVMNSDSILNTLKQGKKGLRRMTRKYGM